MRQKAKGITALLNDDERLRAERANRSTWSARLDESMSTLDDAGRVSPASSGRRPSNRPSSHRQDTEDADLQRAIEESKRTAEEDERRRNQRKTYAGSSAIRSDTMHGRARDDSDADFQRALELSKREADENDRRVAHANEMSLLGGPSTSSDLFNSSAPVIPSSNNPFAAQVQAETMKQQQQQVGYPQQSAAPGVDPFALMALGNLSNALTGAPVMPQPQIATHQQPQLLLDVNPYEPALIANPVNAGALAMARPSSNQINPFGLASQTPVSSGYGGNTMDVFGTTMSSQSQSQGMGAFPSIGGSSFTPSLTQASSATYVVTFICLMLLVDFRQL